MKTRGRKPPQKSRRPAVVQRVPRPIRKAVSESLMLSTCAAKYAIAISKPWDPQATGACVPTTPARPTQKVTAFVRGTVVIGTSGFGFISVAPCLANNQPIAWGSTNSTTFSGTTCGYSYAAVPPGTSDFQCSNLPYSLAQLNTTDSQGLTDAQGRIVSIGLSVQYTGTELNRGGLLYCYSDPAHDSVNTYGTAQVGAKLEAEISPPPSSRMKCWLTAAGCKPDELAFPVDDPTATAEQARIRNAYPLSNRNPLGFAAADLPYGAPIMVACLTGVAGNTYNFEIVVHAEYIGRVTQNMLTPTEDDPDGLGLVQTALGRLNLAKAASPNKSMSQLMKQELLAAAKRIGPAALRAGGTMLLAAL